MSDLTNTTPADTYIRLLQFGSAGNSGVGSLPVRIQDGSGNDTSLLLGTNGAVIGIDFINSGLAIASLSVGRTNTQSSYSSLQGGQYNIQNNVGCCFQMGATNTQGGAYSIQIAQFGTQDGRFNCQVGQDSSQAGDYGMQIGNVLLDSGYNYTMMFGLEKTASSESRAYFAIDNGIWIKPSSNPSILESGCLWYNSISGFCCYISGAARRLAIQP